jgi:hypothetical protein
MGTLTDWTLWILAVVFVQGAALVIFSRLVKTWGPR